MPQRNSFVAGCVYIYIYTDLAKRRKKERGKSFLGRKSDWLCREREEKPGISVFRKLVPHAAGAGSMRPGSILASYTIRPSRALGDHYYYYYYSPQPRSFIFFFILECSRRSKLSSLPLFVTRNLSS